MLLLKTRTFSRASTPTQSPFDPLSAAGTLANVAGATFASSPFSDRSSSSGEFSVKNTSAWDDAPSFTNSLASSGASPE